MNALMRQVEVVREPERIAVLMDPARRRLVRALLERPDSAVGLARRLDDSRQRLGYHLRVMEEAGLVELVEERQRRGARERVFRVVARQFALDPGSLGELSPEPSEGSGDRFSATYLVALASRAIRELAALLGKAEETGKRLATAGLSTEVRLAEPADFDGFVADLGEAVAAVVARHTVDDPGGRTFRVFAGTYPGPASDSSGAREEAT